MNDANRLIRNHEAAKKEWERKVGERDRRNYERYQQQRATEEMRRKEEEQRILQFESQMEDYFR